MATQELVVPRSMPITSPTSSDFHRFPIKEVVTDGARDFFAAIAEVRFNSVELAAESMFSRMGPKVVRKM
jgi:hypothetical protein